MTDDKRHAYGRLRRLDGTGLDPAFASPEARNNADDVADEVGTTDEARAGRSRNGSSGRTSGT